MKELYLNIYKKKFIDERVVKSVVDDASSKYCGVIFMLDYGKVYYVNMLFDYELIHTLPELLERYNKFFRSIVINFLKRVYIFVPRDKHVEPFTVKFA